MISETEANEMLEQFVKLREQCKKSKSKRLHYKYQKQVEICAKTFDYIVQNKVKKYKQFSNYDDLLQDGRVALVMALNSYQLDKGSWFWWCNQYVKTRISREANRHSTIKIPLKQIKNFIPYKTSTIPLIIDNSSALETIETTEEEEKINAGILSLAGMHRLVFQMHYAETPVSYISKELKISDRECRKILQEAKDSLVKYFDL